MNPVIVDKKTKSEVLEFTLKNVDVSIANAIRRTIIADIETIVIKSTPYSENDINITTNTSRINNEILSARISLIPVHELTKNNYEKYVLEVDEENTSDELMYLTTEHFKILNTVDNKYLNKLSVEKIFPPWIAPNGKKYYIELIPLISKVGNISGEKIVFNAKFSISTSKLNSSFNVSSICTYSNTLDPIEIEAQEKIEKEKQKDDPGLEIHMKNWSLLEKERYFTPESFNFKIQTSSQYSNEELVKLACTTIIAGFENIKTMEYNISPHQSTIENSFIIKMDNVGYTLGNVLNHLLIDRYFEKEKVITFSAFKLVHPHDMFGTLILAFSMDVGNDVIKQYIDKCCDTAIELFEKIKKLM
jgi:DNA-directed RNA polymerase subunit L